MLINIVPTAVSDDPTLRDESGLDRSTARIHVRHSAQIYAQTNPLSSGKESGLKPILSDNNVLNLIDPPPDRD
jgi:hypothetical protein